MQKFAALILALALAGCAKVESISDKKTPLPVTSPTASEIPALKPISVKIDLNQREQKYLEKSLPSNVREILEKAEKFEILAEIVENERSERDLMTFEPNRIAKIANEKDKKEILESFYYDAAREDSPANCYEPHHGIRATFQNKTVEIEICFSCSRFEVKSEDGKFDGTITRKNPKNEKIINRIITAQGIEFKN